MPYSPQDAVLPVLAKTLFSGLSISREFHDLIGQSTSSVIIRKSVLPCNVTENNMEYAIIDDFNQVATSAVSKEDPLKELIGSLRTERYSSFCGFWPDTWHSDLKKIGIKTLNIEFTLFSMLDSKIHQLDIIRTYGNGLIKESMDRRAALLGTRFCLPTPSSYFSLREELGDFVAAAPNSAGGSGMFLVRDMSGFIDAVSAIETPVIRVERYLDAVSLTQLGIVFEDATFVYPVQTQYVRMKKKNLSYAGASSDVSRFAGTDVERRATEITRAVGEAIAKLGYLGAFGCDLIYIPSTGDVFFMELNPRFVGETFLFSEMAAAAVQLGDVNRRILVEPHFMHVCAHMMRRCPEEIVALMGSDGTIPVASATKDGYSTLVPLRLLSRPSTQPGMEPRPDFSHRICVLFKDCVAVDPVVPTRFAPPVEEMWTRIQAEQPYP